MPEQPKTTLLTLPNELIGLIAAHLPSTVDINALTQTSRLFHHLFNTYLYGRDVQEGGSSSLLWAATNGNEATFQLALTQNANIHARNPDEQTPLLLAAKNGHAGIVRTLLEYPDIDANVNATIFTAADGGEDYYYDFQTPLITASKNGHSDVVRVLLDWEGIDVNDTDEDGSGNTALIWAAHGGYTEVVTLLAAYKGVDLNKANRCGHTALSFAARGGHCGAVEVLVAIQEVDVNARLDTRSMPLSLARNLGYGRTALQLAVLGGYNDVVELLLRRRDIDLNLADARGQTALWMAGERGDMVAHRLLGNFQAS